MDHYQDILIRMDPEFPTPLLMNALFAKFHRALVQLRSTGIGVSFPSFDGSVPSLGDCLRVHGTVVALQTLHTKDWTAGMRDHVDLAEIAPVPSSTQHRKVRRVQVKSSAARLRRRFINRHVGVTERDVVALIPDSVEERVHLPYLQLKSESTGQSFLLFIEQEPVMAVSAAGEFNCYGLSRTATVPWF